MRFNAYMKINKDNQILFSGIKLSCNDIKSAKRVVRYMRLNGFNCVGKKTYYVNNTISNKIKASNYVRSNNMFYDNEFGVLVFPWSKEVYILSERNYEQKMLDWVREMDPEAGINLLI